MYLGPFPWRNHGDTGESTRDGRSSACMKPSRVASGLRALGRCSRAAAGAGLMVFAALTAAAALAVPPTDAGAANSDASKLFSDHVVPGVSPSGTTINLFDYWNVDQAFGEVAQDTEQGINRGRLLHFSGGKGSIPANSWVGAGKGPRTGMVEHVLVNGFPALSDAAFDGSSMTPTDQNRSLGYLFNTSDYLTGTAGKAAYFDVRGLLQVDSHNYYYYNASRNQRDAGSYESANYAAFYEETNSFVLYDESAVKGTTATDRVGNFFPFTPASTVFTEQAGKLVAKDMKSASKELSHHFGMTMTTRFVQQPGGMTDDGGEQVPVTYEFSGDDDVWVFIDDVLVGDLGGIHDAASLKIDFSTGSVVVTAANGDRQEHTLRGLFEGVLGSEGEDFEKLWSAENPNTFADGSYHTLKFYFLERGGYDSNMSLRFNLVSVPASDIVKVDQDGKPVEGARFSLYLSNEAYSEAKELLATGTTDENGTLELVDKDGNFISLVDFNERGFKHFILREEGLPEKYRRLHKDIHLMLSDGGALLVQNEWETAAYTQVMVTTTLPRTVYDRYGEIVPSDLLESGTVFAVVLQRQDDGEEDPSRATWYPIGGNALKGWHVIEGNSIDHVLEAARENERIFRLTSSGDMKVLVDDLPGDIQKYYSYMQGSGAEADAEYTVGYYFSSAKDLRHATAQNTVRLDANNNYAPEGSEHEPFMREFSAEILVGNPVSRLGVQKLDYQGNPLVGATFSLYRADDCDFAEDGSVSVHEGAQPVDSATTAASASGDAAEEGTATFPSPERGALPKGNYVMMETEAPAGCALNAAPVRVAVTDSGVYAHAGTAGDGVTVRNGVGKILHSMLQFAADDDVDATLHDLEGALRVNTTDAWVTDGTAWVKDQGVTHLYYNYDKESNSSDYSPTIDSEGTVYDQTLAVDIGWSMLDIYQCYDHEGSVTQGHSKKQKIPDGTVLNQLFSGSTLVQVTDVPVADFSLSKIVRNEEQGVSGLSFSFEVRFAQQLPDRQEDISSIFYMTESARRYFEAIFPCSFDYVVRSIEEPSVIYEAGTMVIGPLDDGASAGGEGPGEFGIVSAQPSGGGESSYLKRSGAQGPCHVELAHGEQLLIRDLPAFTEIRATEEPVEGYVSSAALGTPKDMANVVQEAGNVATVTRERSSDAGITFTNTRQQYASLTVEKRVENVGEGGIMPDPDERFAFELALDGVPAGAYPAALQDGAGNDGEADGALVVRVDEAGRVTIAGLGGGGSASFTLRSGQCVSIDVPVPTDGSDATYTLYEKDVPRGYTASIVGEPGGAASAEEPAQGSLSNERDASVVVVNTFDPDPAEAVIEGVKTLYGRAMKDGEAFGFTLTPVNDPAREVLPDSATVAVSGGADGEEVRFAFDPIRVRRVGEYLFQLAETDAGGGALPQDGTMGLRYDRTVWTVAVTVEQRQGMLVVADVAYTPAGGSATDEATFVNTYVPQPVQAAVQVRKTLLGRDGATGETFSFRLRALTDGAPLPEGAGSGVASAVIDAEHMEDGSSRMGAFAPMAFDKTGIYSYEVSEVVGDAHAGTAYDVHLSYVHVAVSDTGDGSYRAQLTYDNDMASAETDQGCQDAAAFTNTYAVGSAAYEMLGTKVMDGRTFKEGDRFTFRVTAQDGGPLPDGVDERGELTVDPPAGDTVDFFSFGTITFDEPGDYTYLVEEVAGDIEGMAYDVGAREVRVIVHQQGSLLVAALAGEDEGDFVWNNRVDPLSDGVVRLAGSKIIEGRSWFEDDRFSFEIAAADDATLRAIDEGALDLPESTRVTIDGRLHAAAGERVDFAFGDIVVREPGVYAFRVTELPGSIADMEYDGTVYTIEVIATEGGDGALSVSAVGAEDMVFTNVYAPSGVPGGDAGDAPGDSATDGSGSGSSGDAASSSGILGGRMLSTGDGSGTLVAVLMFCAGLVIAAGAFLRRRG